MSLPRPLARLAVVARCRWSAVLAVGRHRLRARHRLLAGRRAPAATARSSSACRTRATRRAPSRSGSSSRPRRRWPRCGVQPVPGWTVDRRRRRPLNPPVNDDDGDTITEAVSVVEFDAAPGGGIAPGQFQEFSLSGGPFPNGGVADLPRGADLQRR